ncbi:MAG: hypothetical protein ACI4S0_13255 [Dorea sp.]
MKKMLRTIVVIGMLLTVLTLAACSSKKEEEQGVSEEAQKIIQAIMNCPNSELYDSSLAYVIGDDVEEAQAQEEEMKEKREEIQENWEAEVGDCFAEGALDTFLDQGMATMYFAEAEQENLTYQVQEIELKKKGEVNETVQVSLLKGDKEETVTLVFTHDSEGFITEVKPAS